MSNCPGCGEKTQADQRFCGRCGKPTDLHADPATETSLGAADGVRAARSSGPATSSPDGSPRFLPGTILADRYRIVGPIGRGGMGEVYRADDLKLGQAVALKFLPIGLERDPDRLERFLNEVKLARQVAHPNVCRVYDVGEFEGQHFISMEYVDGEDLASLLRRIGRLPNDKAIQLSRQICAGLAAAHEQGILHRDLKPANVMVDGRGRARIADFGLAGLPESIRGAEILTGTPSYMAPEQLSGRAVSIQSDLYSLGLVLYELFTGKPAFQAASRAELILQQANSEIASPSTLVDGLEPAIERILLHCLNSEPMDRPRSALEVSAALPGGDPIAAALAAGETPSPELIAASGRRESMRPAPAVLLAIAAVALFALAGFWRGHYAVRHYLPLDKQPIALADDAKEMIREIGYTEPVYANPRDQAWGYAIWGSRLRAINRSAKSLDDLEVLRDPDTELFEFWYRQSPLEMIPVVRNFQSLAGASVNRGNPPLRVTGEILIGIDQKGRLDRFAHMPRRFEREIDAPNELDVPWLFGLAGLPLETYTPAEPRFQRFMHTDERWAWTGPSLVGDEVDVRVEAGMQEGRLASFAILSELEMEALAARPESLNSWHDWDSLFVPVIIALWFSCIVMARSNLRKGRADRRGALQLSGATFLFTTFSALLSAHALLQPAGLGQLLFVLISGVIFAVTVALFYLALEPHARRIWPAILVSWSRLSGGSVHGWRDPSVGRSVLAGGLAGAVIGLIYPARIWFDSLFNNGVPWLEFGSWEQLYGTRYALSSLSGSVATAFIQSVSLALFLVIGQRIFRNRIGAIVLAFVITLLLESPILESWILTVAELALLAIVTGIQIALLLRFGLVALFVSIYIDMIEPMSRASDWTQWHASSAWLTLAVVAAIAVYGYWAAARPSEAIRVPH